METSKLNEKSSSSHYPATNVNRLEDIKEDMEKPSDHIYDLIVRHLSDKLTSEECQELQAWIEETDEHAVFFRQMEELWLSSPSSTELEKFDCDKAFALFVERINDSKRSQRRHLALKWMRYAAAIAVVAGICSYLSYLFGQHTLEEKFAQIHIEASQGSTTKMVLPDGSTIWLNSGSHASYSQGYGVSDRTIELSGEGYFEVKKNAKLPFNVRSSNLNVRVLGTKFDFRDYPDDAKAMVSLVEGSVALGIGKEKDDRYQLVPNQRAQLDKETGNLSITDCVASEARLWTDGILMLNGRSLKEIAKDLGRSYNAHIAITSAQLEDLHFYGTFLRKEQSLNEVLHMLAATGRIKYSIHDREVKIYK